MLKKLNEKTNEMMVRAMMALNNTTADGATDATVPIIITVVLAALAITTLTTLWNGTISTKLTTAVTELFG